MARKDLRTEDLIMMKAEELAKIGLNQKEFNKLKELSEQPLLIESDKLEKYKAALKKGQSAEELKSYRSELNEGPENKSGADRHAKEMLRQKAIAGIQNNRVGINEIKSHLLALSSKISNETAGLESHYEQLATDNVVVVDDNDEIAYKVNNSTGSSIHPQASNSSKVETLRNFSIKLNETVGYISNIQATIDKLHRGTENLDDTDRDVLRNVPATLSGAADLLRVVANARADKNASYYNRSDIVTAKHDLNFVEEKLQPLFNDRTAGVLIDYDRTAMDRQAKLNSDTDAKYAAGIEKAKDHRTIVSHEKYLEERRPGYKKPSYVAEAEARREARKSGKGAPVEIG